MEQVKEFFVTYWPTILEGILMFVAYFLVFLYNNKIVTTKNLLTTSFKERVAYVEEIRDTADKRLIEAERKYLDAVNLITDLRQRLDRAETALILITDMEVDDGRE